MSSSETNEELQSDTDSLESLFDVVVITCYILFYLYYYLAKNHIIEIN